MNNTQTTNTMNAYKVTREFSGRYSVTLTDYNLTFVIEDLKPYKIEGVSGWEVKTYDDRAEDLGVMYTDTLRSAKLWLKYLNLSDFGITK